jgi:hypothetical protein
VTAALALLLRKRAAIWLFAFSFVAIVVTNSYELVVGTSRMLVTRGALIVTVVIALIAMFEVAYARALARRAVLR